MDQYCPLCRYSSLSWGKKMSFDSLQKECVRCGEYEIDENIKDFFESFSWEAEECAVISHLVRMQYETNNKKKILLNQLFFDPQIKKKKAGEQLKVPSIQKQINNLIMLIGDEKGGKLSSLPSLRFDNGSASGFRLVSCVGAFNHNAFRQLVRICFDEELVYPFELGGAVEVQNKPKGFSYEQIRCNPLDLSLTYKGWQRYEQLKTGHAGNTVFLAMQFGKDDKEKAENNKFYAALKDIVENEKLGGFKLDRMDKKPQAGIIDDIMRTRIRESRFLLVDLSHENKGAYWEAGFAEGLDKPVIYLCYKKKFKKVHFDVNHCTILEWEWDKENDNEFSVSFRKSIEACIKNTLATAHIKINESSE